MGRAGSVKRRRTPHGSNSRRRQQANFQRSTVVHKYQSSGGNNPLDYNTSMITIAELPEYIRRAEKLMSDAERLDVVNYLAAQPKAGDLMEGTGGVRKLRWGRGAKGKSGGVRVIYYVHSDLMPLYLLTLFAKNERANLSKAERNELADLVELLVQTWLEP